VSDAFEVERSGTLLSGQAAGDGPAVLALHGLTATRRYVLMGSRSLERDGRRVVSYDARGHGESGPAGDGRYDYEELALDALAVMDRVGAEQAVLAGVSMGAHTAAAVALAAPERVAGLVFITPAYDPDAQADPLSWDRLARGLRDGGIEGFLAAYELDALDVRWRETAERVIRQRLEAQRHPAALADALEGVPRSRPFESWQQLGAIEAPAIVIASRDEADPAHPLSVGERWASELPGAALHVERSGEAPLAWQGGRVSALIGSLAS